MKIDRHSGFFQAAYQSPLLLHAVIRLRCQKHPAKAAGFGGLDVLIADRRWDLRAEDDESPDGKKILQGGGERAEPTRGKSTDDHPAFVHRVLLENLLVGGLEVPPGDGDILPMESLHAGHLGGLDIGRDKLPSKPGRGPGGPEIGRGFAAAVQGDEEGVLSNRIETRGHCRLDLQGSFFLGFSDSGLVLFEESLEARGALDLLPVLGREVPFPVEYVPAVAFFQGLDRFVGVSLEKTRQGQIVGIGQDVFGEPVQDTFQKGGCFGILFFFEELSEVLPHLLVASEFALLLALERAQ